MRAADGSTRICKRRRPHHMVPHLLDHGVELAPGPAHHAGDGLLEDDALDTDATPLHLPLGDDAVDAILGHLDSVRAEVTTWEKLARNTRLTQ